MGVVKHYLFNLFRTQYFFTVVVATCTEIKKVYMYACYSSYIEKHVLSNGTLFVGIICILSLQETQ